MTRLNQASAIQVQTALHSADPVRETDYIMATVALYMAVFNLFISPRPLLSPTGRDD
jgi:FtsH-binding integral membrane protein